MSKLNSRIRFVRHGIPNACQPRTYSPAAFAPLWFRALEWNDTSGSVARRTLIANRVRQEREGNAPSSATSLPADPPPKLQDGGTEASRPDYYGARRGIPPLLTGALSGFAAVLVLSIPDSAREWGSQVGAISKCSNEVS